MEVKEFRFLHVLDKYDKQYESWSRVYEYPAVIKSIVKEFGVLHTKWGQPLTIHNTAWGSEGDHVKFKEELDSYHHWKCRHSDIVGEDIYDITQPTNKTYDVVLNVSTLEHLEPVQQKKALTNLIKQVKPKGLLILTFDFPRVDKNFLEDVFNHQCDRNGVILNGINSVRPNPSYSGLEIILLVARKGE